MPDSIQRNSSPIFGVVYRAPRLKSGFDGHACSLLSKSRRNWVSVPELRRPDGMDGEVECRGGRRMVEPQQQQQQQQQHAPGVETLGDGSEPPESELAVTGVVHAEQQQEPSPPVTSAEPFPLLLDEPDVVHGDVSCVAVRREPSVTEGFGNSVVLGVGTQQQQEVQQQQRSEPVAVGAVAASMGRGRRGVWRPAVRRGR